MSPEEEKQYNLQRRNLRIILVLSIIGSGCSFFAYLMYGMMLPTFKELYANGILRFPSEFTVYVEQIFETPRSYYLCCTLLYAMSLAGVIFMWNLHKNGFHLYTLAQLLVLLVTGLFLGREYISLGNIMMTLLFITYYYIAFRNLAKYMPEGETNASEEESKELETTEEVTKKEDSEEEK